MANEEHLAVLRQGMDAWNKWRKEHPDVVPNLCEVDLSRADLRRAHLRRAYLRRTNLSGADLSETNLRAADLSETNLREVDLIGADLRGADLRGAQFSEANLRGADFRRANLKRVIFSESDLGGADLSGANLHEANLSRAHLHETVFADVDLSATKGLDACTHQGPSIIDHRTLQRSGRLPLTFLRGCGLPDRLIDYLPSLLEEAIRYYTCFISYSSKDDAFAKRLHADLQNNGVRCWFAPHDLPIGAKTWDAIDAAIRVRDKLLLILLQNAIASDWVEDEVGKAFAEEKRRGQVVLFPVRIDEEVMETAEPWAVKLRDQRNIGDFRRWKDHDAYQRAFNRVLRDLKATPG
jgi:uncharacterized protein YjbI with pentapeptide repeats